MPTLEEITAVHESNRAKIEALARKGLAVQFPPHSAVQIDTLIEFLFPEGTEDRLDFEMAVARKLEELIDGVTDNMVEQARAAAARSTLLQGVSIAPPAAPIAGQAPLVPPRPHP